MFDKKPYNTGLLVGRFQMLHNGHVQMITKACELCERVILLVGSAQEHDTAKNPFTYELRESMLKKVFGNDVEIYPLTDIGIGNVSAWGEYVLRSAREKCGVIPELVITGKEARRTSWYDGENGKTIAELSIPKSIDISASDMRTFLINGEKDIWMENAPTEIYSMYDELRHIVLMSKDKTETMSV